MHLGAGIGRKSLAVGMETANASTPVATLAMALTDNGPVMSQAALAISAVATVSVATATTVSMAVTLDSSLTFVSAAGSGWTCNAAGQVVTCTRATQAIGVAPTVTINVTSGSATKTTSNTGTLDATGATQAVSNTDAAQVNLVSKDATSGIRVPASATEWTNLMTAAGLATGNPSLLWLSQEASGNLADTIGAFTGTAAGAAYAQTVSGWTRKGVLLTGAATVQNAAAGLPAIDSASMLVLSYALFPATVTTTRSVVTLGTTFGAQAAANFNTGPKITAQVDPNASNGAATTFSAVHPLVVQVDRVHTAALVCTEQEKLAPALTSTPSGKAIVLGGDNVQTWFSGQETHMYTAAFFNAAAALTQAQVKTLLQTLGWTVAW